MTDTHVQNVMLPQRSPSPVSPVMGSEGYTQEDIADLRIRTEEGDNSAKMDLGQALFLEGSYDHALHHFRKLVGSPYDSDVVVP
eukprot:Clim_evm121s149 gene=Clim_evmTU121s149